MSNDSAETGDVAEAVVRKLSALGRPDEDLWRDYRSLGVTPAHVPALIELATGPLVFETHEALVASSEEEAPAAVWAPVHAWRALGELRAGEAAAPLVALFPRADAADDEWALEELPRVLALIGEAALPPLEQSINDLRITEAARIPATTALEKIAAAHAPLRNRCAAILAGALGRLADNQRTLNGFIVAALLDLKAREHAEVIERAYKAGKVDAMICGTVADVRAELGLTGPPAPGKPPAPAPKKWPPSLDVAISAALPKWNKPEPKQR